MDHLEKQPHVHMTKATARPVAIVVGDPARASELAALADSSVPLADNREYRSFIVTFEGEEIIVMSHGIGSAGAAICFEEMLKCGVKVIIRAGTCGSLQPQRIVQGDVVVCFGAAADSKVTELMAPPGFPCVADPEAHAVLRDAAKKEMAAEPARLHEGTALSSDIFYSSPVVPNYLERYQKCNMDVVEMELGTLFLICRLRNAKAAGIAAVDGCPLQWSEGNYISSPERLAEAKKKMLRASLAAAAELTRREASS